MLDLEEIEESPTPTTNGRISLAPNQRENQRKVMSRVPVDATTRDGAVDMCEIKEKVLSIWSTNPSNITPENFELVDVRKPSLSGAAEVQPAQAHTAILHAAAGRANDGMQPTNGYAAAVHCAFEAVAVENTAASPRDSVSLPDINTLGLHGRPDVKEPPVYVEECNADRLLADEAEKVLKGEKKGRRGGVSSLLFAPSSFTSNPVDLP